MSDSGEYAVVIADFHGPVTLVSEPSDPEFAPAKNALGPGMSSSALALGASLWVFPPSSPEEASAAVALQQRVMDGIGSATTDFALLDIDSQTRAGHQRTFALSLWPAFSLVETESAHSVVAPTDADWSAYTSVNAGFAHYISRHAASGARVMVRDIELLLLPGLLNELRPDLSVSFFSFAPWATAAALRVLPRQMARSISESLSTADDVGFLSQGSVQRFRDAMRAVLPGASPRTRHYPLPIDRAEIAEKAFSPATQDIVNRLTEDLPELRLIARAERAERPANLLGGLKAYRCLLTLYPQWRSRVAFIHAVFPGSLDAAAQEMLNEAEKLSDEINAEFGTATWRPSEFSANIDYPRSLALMRIADVYVSNPTQEAMSITTWEALELNERSAAFILSSATGIAELFPDEVLIVDADDIDATARAIHEGLLLPDGVRSERLHRMRVGVRAWSPTEWFAAQLAGQPSDISCD